MPIITLAPDGSIPLPEELRKTLAVSPGDQLSVEIVDGALRIAAKPTAPKENKTSSTAKGVASKVAGSTAKSAAAYDAPGAAGAAGASAAKTAAAKASRASAGVASHPSPLPLSRGARGSLDALTDGEGRGGAASQIPTLTTSAPTPPLPTGEGRGEGGFTHHEELKTVGFTPREELKTAIRAIKGVGPKLAEVLAKKGIETVEDALYILPNRYEDRRELKRISELRPGNTEAFFATVVSAEPLTTKGGRRYFEAIVRDESGSLPLKWFHFHPTFMKKNFQPGRRGIFIGDVAQFGFQREMHHPEVEWAAEGEELSQVMARDPENFGRILPVYPLTEGVSQKLMRRIMRETVQRYSRFVTATLPDEIVQRHKLLSLPVALREAHAPDPSTSIAELNSGRGEAHRSLAFDELFFLQLGLALKGRGVALEDGISFKVTHRYTKELLKLSIGFEN